MKNKEMSNLIIKIINNNPQFLIKNINNRNYKGNLNHKISHLIINNLH